MACCANRKSGPPRRGELLVRAGFRVSLVTLEGGLSLAAPLSSRVTLWRDFTAMLRDAEEQESSCVLQDSEPTGAPRLGRVLSGRLLAFSPAAAGFVYRKLVVARPGLILDGAAELLAEALEHHAQP